MAKVIFKTKAQVLHDGDQTVRMFNIPKITRSHCDMHAFRTQAPFSNYANSDLFLGLINRELKKLYPSGYIRSDRLTSNTEIKPGFLTQVSIEL